MGRGMGRAPPNTFAGLGADWTQASAEAVQFKLSVPPKGPLQTPLCSIPHSAEAVQFKPSVPQGPLASRPPQGPLGLQTPLCLRGPIYHKHRYIKISHLIEIPIINGLRRLRT